MCPNRTLPPDPLCRGTSPIQVAKCRPERKELGSGMVAAKALAVIRPMPGIVSRRWLIQALAQLIRPMPGQDLMIDLTNTAVDVLNLSEDQTDASPRQVRQGGAACLLGQFHELGNAGKT
jgi:hypothetical protein